MEFKKCKAYHYENVQDKKNLHAPFLVDALVLFFWPLEPLQLVPPTPLQVLPYYAFVVKLNGKSNMSNTGSM